MIHSEAFGKAKWIMPKEDMTSALFRKEFFITGKNAKITICGLGYFILYINGKRVSDEELVPAYSDYIPRKRENMNLIYPLNDEMDNRIYFLEYDISAYLNEGLNVLGVMLGGGYFHQTDRKAEGNMDYGNIRLCYKITAENEEYFSDETTLYKQGFIKKSSLFYGEYHDYNGFDYSWNTVDAEKENWLYPVFCDDTEDVDYNLQKCNADKITRTLSIKKLHDFGEYSVYDAGENITGYAVVKCKEKGETITLKFAELLCDDGNLSFHSAGGEHQIASDTFVTDGKTDELYPRLLWHGFRYFSLTNNAEPIEVREVHTDMAVTSDFECSDENINWIYKTYLHTQLSNIHSGVPTDCPHRERLGYTGDGQLCAPAVMLSFDSKELYKKWIQDIIDSQDKTTGHVQHTAPFSGGGGGPAGWGGAIITVIYHYTKYFGDLSILEKYYDNMCLFADYMESRCENGIIVREEEKGWCLGDWCTPEKIAIPEAFVNTCMYITQLEMIAFCTELLGKDSKKYKKLASLHRKCVAEKYPPDENGSFLMGLQGADFFAVDSNVGDENTLSELKEKYEKLGCFDTGIFGTYIACNVLFKNGFSDVALKMLGSEEENHSFGYMKKSGATTIWEDWDGGHSNNHPMFGACVKTFFENILGITQSEGSLGFDDVIIAPAKNNTLNFAKGYITTPKGKISVEYKKSESKTDFIINICGGIKTAEFRFDGKIYPLNEGENKITC